MAWRNQLYEVSILCRVHWGRRDSTLVITSSNWLVSLIVLPRRMTRPAPAEAALMALCSDASAFLLCAGVREYSLSSTPKGTRAARVINLHWEKEEDNSQCLSPYNNNNTIYTYRFCLLRLVRHSMFTEAMNVVIGMNVPSGDTTVRCSKCVSSFSARVSGLD